MELRHLRYFVAVAEELHFARAAERLHIEQSPLSRAIKDLEFFVGASLFVRTTRTTRLTRAGRVLLEDARRILVLVEEAKRNVAAAANGFRGHLRIGLADGVTQPRVADLLARSRLEDPGVDIRIVEMSIAQQIISLRCDQLDAGFAMAGNVPQTVTAEPVWKDSLAVLAPTGHPILEQESLSLGDLKAIPLVLGHPDRGSGCTRQIEAMLGIAGVQPLVADYVTALGTMLTLVGAGFGIGVATEAQLATVQRSDVGVRALDDGHLKLTAYLLRASGEPSNALLRFAHRATSGCGVPDAIAAV